MDDENNKKFEPKQIAPTLGNPHLPPLNHAHNNEIKISYSRNVKIAGVIVAIIILLAITAVYLLNFS